MWSLTDINRATHVPLSMLELAAATLQIRLGRDFNRERGAKCVLSLEDWHRIRSYVTVHTVLNEKSRNAIALLKDNDVIAIMQRNRMNRFSFARRVCDNCGLTAENSRLAMMFYVEDRNIAEISVTRNISLQNFLMAISAPTDDHILWDVSFPNHTWLLERCPTNNRNLISQSYQGAFNLQFWLGLTGASCYREARRQNYEVMRDTWRNPSDDDLARLATAIGELIASNSFSDRKERWKLLPFDPYDDWNQPGETVMTIHRYEIIPKFSATILDVAIQEYLG